MALCAHPRLNLCLLFLAAACSNSDCPPPLATATIGPAGGSLAAPEGAPAMNVPAGALAQDIVFRVDPGVISIVPGFVDVGQAFEFSPANTVLAVPAQLLIPFDPARLPDPTATGDLQVGLRTSTGQVVALAPSTIDTALGRATFATSQLGTFWLAAPDVVAPDELFPLGNGDIYLFDTGLVLSVARTTVEPNFEPLEVQKVTFTRVGFTDGLYLDDSNGNLAMLGRWQVPTYQQRDDIPVLLIADGDPIGYSRVVIGSYLGFSPFGTSIGAYTGLQQVKTRLIKRVSVVTALGYFDTVHVRIESQWIETPGGQGADSLDLWLANGVGPVQVRFNDGVIETVRGGTVGGQPITGY